MLAADLGTDLIVFGSEYRTPDGHVQAGASAERLLDGGESAIALAPAGMRGWSDTRIGALASVAHDGGEQAQAVATGLAQKLGGEVGAGPEGADVVVLASRPDSPAGHVQLSSAVRGRLDEAMVPVIVLPTGSKLAFSG